MTLYYWFLAAEAILCCVTSSYALDVTSVDNVLTAAQACNAEQNPAIAVSVVKDGAILLSSGYGVTTPRGTEKVSNNTRFNIASLSKSFAATLFLKVMQEDGRYNLSTKVRDILGKGFKFGDRLRTEEATVEDVLSHKIAIPANNRMRFNENLTRANLQDRLQYLHSPFAFRNVFVYSNIMYGLATRMTEITGNARWEELLVRHFYQPLNMNRSTFAKELKFDEPGVALPVDTYYGQLKSVPWDLPGYWSELAGSGAVVTTANDMAQWMLFHLSLGKGPDGHSVMPAKTLQQLYEARTAQPSSITTKFTRPEVPVTLSYDVYGLGFRRGYYRGYPTLGHGGSTFGYRSLMTFIPSKNIGVFVTMSGTDPNYYVRGTYTTYLLDQALGDVEPWLNVTTFCSFPEPWFHASKNDKPAPYNVSLPLAYNVNSYLGTYVNRAYGFMEIRAWKDGSDEGKEVGAKLTAFFGFGTWDLIPLPPSSSSSSFSSSSSSLQHFYGKGRNASAWVDYSPFIFHPPSAGSDLIIKLSVPGFESQLPPVFARLGYGQYLATSGCSKCIGDKSLEFILFYALLTFSLQPWLNVL